MTLVELLACISIIGVLIALGAPALRGAREAARSASCTSNQRQLSLGWTMYAGAFAERAMPLADEGAGGEIIYWWGAFDPATGAVDHARGFLTPFLEGGPGERSVYECAAQPWGTYTAQPQGAKEPRPTSTYGYNGYYLCPPMTPGWSAQIGGRPWRRLSDVEHPSRLLVFADAMLPTMPVRNCALLDPPRLFWPGKGWEANPSPTTAFRHGRSGGGAAGAAGGAAAGAGADGSVTRHAARPEWLTHPALGIGSVGTANGPHYVPDWEQW